MQAYIKGSFWLPYIKRGRTRGANPSNFYRHALIFLCCQKGTDFFDTEETVKESKTAMALVMNQSLTPTKLDPKAPFSPSNYPDKRSVVAAYKRMVGSFQPLVEMLESSGVLENAIL